MLSAVLTLFTFPIVPSVSCGESSSSTVTGGFGSLSSLLRSFTPGGGHQTVTNLQIHDSISDDAEFFYFS